MYTATAVLLVAPMLVPLTPLLLLIFIIYYLLLYYDYYHYRCCWVVVIIITFAMVEFIIYLVRVVYVFISNRF